MSAPITDDVLPSFERVPIICAIGDCTEEADRRYWRDMPTGNGPTVVHSVSLDSEHGTAYCRPHAIRMFKVA